MQMEFLFLNMRIMSLVKLNWKNLKKQIRSNNEPSSNKNLKFKTKIKSKGRLKRKTKDHFLQKKIFCSYVLQLFLSIIYSP